MTTDIKAPKVCTICWIYFIIVHFVEIVVQCAWTLNICIVQVIQSICQIDKIPNEWLSIRFDSFRFMYNYRDYHSILPIFDWMAFLSTKIVVLSVIKISKLILSTVTVYAQSKLYELWQNFIFNQLNASILIKLWTDFQFSNFHNHRCHCSIFELMVAVHVCVCGMYGWIWRTPKLFCFIILRRMRNDENIPKSLQWPKDWKYQLN